MTATQVGDLFKLLTVAGFIVLAATLLGLWALPDNAAECTARCAPLTGHALRLDAGARVLCVCEAADGVLRVPR